MAPLYTSQPLSNKAVQSPDYVQRGLDGRNTGRLEELHFVGIPTSIQPLYPQYVGNLPAFLTATATRRKVTCGGTYYPTIEPSLLLPISLPPLTLAPLKPFNKDEDKAAFMSKLPGDTLTTVYLKRECYVVKDLDASALTNLPATDPNVPSSPDAVSLAGMRQLLSTLKIITLFLATHTYPAFQTDDGEGDQMTALDMDIHFKDGPTKESMGFRGEKEIYRKGSRTPGWSAANPDAPIEGQPAEDQKRISALGGVYVAKPAPLYPSVNYGPPNQVPNMPGFVLPYFHGMIYPARDSTIAIMRRFFFACFGSVEERNSKWDTWVKGVSKWHRTRCGMAVSHILFSLQTALECQGRLFVVLSNREYVGSVILGFRFEINADGLLLKSDSSARLREHIMTLDEHSKAVSEVTKILKGMALLGDSEPRADVVVDISDPRRLYKELQIRERPSDEEKEELMEWMGKLGFHQKYWSISGETLKRAIDLLLSDEEIGADLPMFPDPTSMFDADPRIFQVFSVFGPTAPSLIDGAGMDVRIPEGLKADDPQSEIAPGTTSIRMPKLYVTAKKLHVACNDWKGVLNRRKIRQNTTERAGGFRMIPLVGARRDMVWNALKMIPVKKFEGKGKGKRVAEEEDVEMDGGSGKKQRVELVEESLGLF